VVVTGALVGQMRQVASLLLLSCVGWIQRREDQPGGQRASQVLPALMVALMQRSAVLSTQGKLCLPVER
jgi:hypothetical protein